MSKRFWAYLWSAAVAVLVVTLVGQLVAWRAERADAATTGRGITAVWAFHPRTIQEARAKARLIVLAEVVSVRRGADLVLPVKAAAPPFPNSEDRVHTQQVTVRVVKAYQGQAATGQTLTLFQTGSPTFGYPEDDPGYRAGERYVLLLQPGPRNLLSVISPEGRYRIEANSAVTPMAMGGRPNSFVEQIRSKPLAALEALLAVP